MVNNINIETKLAMLWVLSQGIPRSGYEPIILAGTHFEPENPSFSVNPLKYRKIQRFGNPLDSLMIPLIRNWARTRILNSL